MSEIRPRLAELLKSMEERRAALTATATQINPAFASIRPRPGAWSAAGIMDHLVKVEAGIANMVERSVEWARTHEIGPHRFDEPLTGRLDEFGVADGSTKMDAPPTVVPGEENPGIEQSLASLAESRRRLVDALVAGSDLDLTEVKRPHRVLGELDMYQWALFVSQHEERHRRQMERTMEEVTERAAECAPIV